MGGLLNRKDEASMKTDLSRRAAILLLAAALTGPAVAAGSAGPSRLPEAPPLTARAGIASLSGQSVPLPAETRAFILAEAERRGVPAALAWAVIEQESGFDPAAISPTGDYGLMQINRRNHAWLRQELGVEDFLDPEQNAAAGLYLLGQHLKACDGDIHRALMRYNLGPTGAKRLWDKGIFSTEYSRQTVGRMERYQAEGSVCEIGGN